jgi:hypothetical protein
VVEDSDTSLEIADVSALRRRAWVALTEDESIQPYRRRKERAPAAGRGRRGRAGDLRRRQADQRAMLREAYRAEGEARWSRAQRPARREDRDLASDLEMLRREAARARVRATLADELAQLSRQRSGSFARPPD